MAQDQGAAGSGDNEPGAFGNDGPDAPELWGTGGYVGDGRYRLTHRLGRGGMAEVFAAEDVRLGRTVAVKLLRSDLAEDPVSKARFTREAQSVAGLNHHAVVAVYDSGEEASGGRVTSYIVMELVSGRTIRELLIDSAAPPPPEQALTIVSGVLEALAYSHQHGIVHRDIKPANVIITETGTVKVMDFGIARALHGAAQTMTQTGMVMGTPQYLSPEQALGKTVDTRSDLYAVGCLLYELLTNRPPFVGETPLSVVYQHVQDTPRLPSEVAPDCPPELDGLVMRALTKEPEDRYQTAEEMRGMVQYALRRLEEHGSHTAGLWNTGSVTGGSTPPLGTPASTRATTSARTPAGGVPLLIGGPDGGDPRGSASRGSRARILIVAILAVVAIGTGVLFASNFGGDDGGGTPSESDPTGTTQTDDEQPTEATRTEDDGEEEGDQGSDDGYDPSEGWNDPGWNDDTPTDDGEEQPSPTEDESDDPTTPPPTEDTEEPPPPTPTDPPTDEEPPPGADDGGTTEGDGTTTPGGDAGVSEGATTGDAAGATT
ncbi:protein kinase domain-containing protein [Streptomyces avicenniae]|uniref:protein kinase domain-containing protein n=1 Tax=Streptomyces avicenniae TaxID=500153 RepID=UPI00069B3CE2|nr:protein kinase [Streptomyces avicenniae]